MPFSSHSSLSSPMQAVVIGGGIAGLVTARVLAPHFQSVLVIEKDAHVGSGEPRFGSAQGAHLHVLLKKGQELLEELFPGVSAAFEANHCPVIDWAQDTVWETRLGAFPRYPSSIKTYSFSKPLLEKVIHSEITKIENVSIIHGQVSRLALSDQKIRSVTLSDGRTFNTDCVALATGSNLHLDTLLPDSMMNLKTETLPLGITYYSVFLKSDSVHLSDARLGKYKQYYYQADPAHETFGSVICPIENGRTLATLIEFGPKPDNIRTFPELISKARAVPGERLAHALEKAEPLSRVACFHKRSMHRMDLRRSSEIPPNLVLIGDSFSSLNPVFGQGMTSVLMQARALEKLIKAEGPNALSSRYAHRLFRKETAPPYRMSALGSLSDSSIGKRYLTSYTKKSLGSKPHHIAFIEALHLKRPITSLFDPAVAFSALIQREN